MQTARLSLVTLLTLDKRWNMACRTVCGAEAETGARVAVVPLLPLARRPWRLEAVEGSLTCQTIQFFSGTLAWHCCANARPAQHYQGRAPAAGHAISQHAVQSCWVLHLAVGRAALAQDARAGVHEHAVCDQAVVGLACGAQDTRTSPPACCCRSLRHCRCTMSTDRWQAPCSSDSCAAAGCAAMQAPSSTTACIWACLVGLAKMLLLIMLRALSPQT